LDALFNIFLEVFFLLLGLKARTYRSSGVSPNNPRRRSLEAARSKGFWRKLFGGQLTVEDVLDRPGKCPI
jgi:hypothetical protein